MRRPGHIPKPFVRPRAVLVEEADVARAWQYIPTATVLEGDIVVDYGKVVRVEHGLNVTLQFLSGAVLSSADLLAVKAFHPVS